MVSFYGRTVAAETEQVALYPFCCFLKRFTWLLVFSNSSPSSSFGTVVLDLVTFLLTVCVFLRTGVVRTAGAGSSTTFIQALAVSCVTDCVVCEKPAKQRSENISTSAVFMVKI